MGVYQIRQAKSYSKEHQTDAGKYQIFVNKEQDGIIKAYICSWYTSSRTFNLWIEHSICLNPVTSARIVGCCAHIESVLWYS